MRISSNPLQTLAIGEQSAVKVTSGFVLHCIIRLCVCSIVDIKRHLRISRLFRDDCLGREESLHLDWQGLFLRLESVDAHSCPCSNALPRIGRDSRGSSRSNVTNFHAKRAEAGVCRVSGGSMNHTFEPPSHLGRWAHNSFVPANTLIRPLTYFPYCIQRRTRAIAC